MQEKPQHFACHFTYSDWLALSGCYHRNGRIRWHWWLVFREIEQISWHFILIPVVFRESFHRSFVICSDACFYGTKKDGHSQNKALSCRVLCLVKNFCDAVYFLLKYSGMHCYISLSECLLDSFPVQVTLLGTTYFHPFPVYNVYCLFAIIYPGIFSSISY